jgi:hypothetical protein
MSLFQMIERTIIPVKTGIQIFVILSPSLRSRVNSAKDLVSKSNK